MKNALTLILLSSFIILSCGQSDKKNENEKEKFEFSVKTISTDSNYERLIQYNNSVIALNGKKLMILNNDLNLNDSLTKKLDSLIVYDPFIYDKRVLLLTYTGMKELDSNFSLLPSNYPMSRANLQWQHLYDDENYHVSKTNGAVSFFNKKSKKDFILSSANPIQVFSHNNSYYVVNNVADASIYQVINNPDSLTEVENRDTVRPFVQNSETRYPDPVYSKGGRAFFESQTDTSKRFLNTFLSFPYKSSVYSIMTSEKAVFLYKLNENQFEIVDTLMDKPLFAGAIYPTSYNNKFLSYFSQANNQNGVFVVDGNNIVLYLFNKKN